MGDMADDIEGLYDAEEFRAFVALRDRRCRYCNSGRLHWVKTNEGWRLYHEDDVIHRCAIIRKNGEKPMTKLKTFWILWQPASDVPPRVRYDTKKAAQEAAEVMTARHQVEFYVLKTEALCQISVAPIKWTTTKEKI